MTQRRSLIFHLTATSQFVSTKDRSSPYCRHTLLCRRSHAAALFMISPQMLFAASTMRTKLVSFSDFFHKIFVKGIPTTCILKNLKLDYALANREASFCWSVNHRILNQTFETLFLAVRGCWNLYDKKKKLLDDIQLDFTECYNKF